MSNKKRSLISVDIGSSAVKAVYGIVSGDKLRIISKNSMAMPAGVYSNGTVLDQIGLSKILSELFKSIKARTKNIAVAYVSSEVIKRELQIPKVSDGDIEDLIKYEITEFLPINIDDYVMQHKINGETEDGSLRASVVAVPKLSAETLFETIKDIGYNPVLMDIHSSSLENMVMASDNLKDSNYALVDLGHNMINVSVFEKGKFIFNRIINHGLSTFNQILDKLKEIEDPNRYKFNDIALIPEIWDAYRFGGLANINLGSEIRYVVEDIVLNLDAVLDEIDKIIKYYNNRNSGNNVEKILLYGGGSQLNEVAEMFMKKFENPTTILELGDYVEIPPAKENSLYVNAVSVMIGATNEQ